jgi:hypothetical protein
MADTKISALTAITPPLAGTEPLPIVQSSTTKKVTVAELQAAPVAAGTANGVQYLNGSKVPSTSSGFTVDSSGVVSVLNNSNWGFIYQGQSGGVTGSLYSDGSAFGIAASTSNLNNAMYVTSTNQTVMRNNNVESVRIDSSNNFKITTGNLVIGTSGKGIDFSATSDASGMTSELLSDYEEGTWTPTWSVSGGTIAAVNNEGYYTKIGRQVFVGGYIAYGNSTTGSPSGTLSIAGLPFTSNATGYGQSGGRQAGRGPAAYNFWGTTPTSQSLYVANNSSAITTPASYSDMSLSFSNSDQIYFFVTYFV